MDSDYDIPPATIVVAPRECIRCHEPIVGFSYYGLCRECTELTHEDE